MVRVRVLKPPCYVLRVCRRSFLLRLAVALDDATVTPQQSHVSTPSMPCRAFWLAQTVLPRRISGVLVHNAHRVVETSSEAFILRYRVSHPHVSCVPTPLCNVYWVNRVPKRSSCRLQPTSPNHVGYVPCCMPGILPCLFELHHTR